ncbi:TetR/AcrR family transcriptional regulator [Actinokineospora spheciospongiae]|uniref:TetR/AcrR family transcriptional regulator n=1 Tax=Actinokineospora spheciospongiae TaxID=909613 RepID=UPI000D8DB02C|nr:TetR/AcrR family transcriptional regulator [Actinokineospora spheciospongiae]PWW64569.1 TetR family transcriptional regulator [Actinokineospora spheciospongiae]
MVAAAQNRTQLIEVATNLLAAGGPDAVTTRAVATAAGLQPPAIYRLFGDKDGLLDAVAEHAYAAYVRGKVVDHSTDPLADFRAGWDLHVGFGLANPAVYALAVDPRRTSTSRATEAGREVLLTRIRRIAAAGRLRVGEQLAADLTHAIGTGTVLALIAEAPERRNPALADVAYRSLLSAILTEAPALPADGATAAAAALRTAVPELDVLSPAERGLLTEWLDRITTRPPTGATASPARR